MGRPRKQQEEKNLKAVFIPEDNRWLLLDEDEEAPKFDYAPRTYDQKAVLHTSEEVHVNLGRAYNLEQMIPISDRHLEISAKERGQHIGQASRFTNHADSPPEN